MDLELLFAPEADDHAPEPGLASPMGGKHQRNLSLSAKWASNKALALEYLKRQREMMLWIETVLDRKFPTHDLYENLKSGIVLRELFAKLYPEPAECLSPISRNYSSRMAPWKERENISVFLKQCKALGMNDLFLFCTDDLYEGTNMVQVLFAVQHFMEFSQEKSNHFHLYRPAITQEALTFSNQEVEMALSKIEMAGVDANALFNSAPSSANPSPLKTRSDDPSREDSGASIPTDGNDRDTSLQERSLDLNNSVSANEDDQEIRSLGSEPADDECSIRTSAKEVITNKNSETGLILESSKCCPSAENIRSAEPTSEVTYDGYQEEKLLENEVREEIIEAEDVIADLEVANSDELARLAQDQDAKLANSILPSSEEIKIAAVPDARADETSSENSSSVSEVDNSEVIIAQNVGDTSADAVVIQAAGAIFGSEARTEITDKHETSAGDSQAPTVVDTPAAGAEVPMASRATRASKKASKTSKAGKKTRQSSEEQLDAEAMSRCTCGSKCTIM